MTSSITDTALTTLAAAPRDLVSGIQHIERVSLRTMRFNSMLPTIVTQIGTSEVLLMSDWLKMVRSYTAAVLTQVVNLKSGWNRAIGKLVGHSMRAFMAAATIETASHKESSIAVSIQGTCPVPARFGLFNLRPEALHEGDSSLEGATSRHGASPNWLMHPV